MTLYEGDTFVCPQCGQHAISNDDLQFDLVGGEPEYYECPECGWMGDDPEDAEPYSQWDTREEQQGLK